MKINKIILDIILVKRDNNYMKKIEILDSTLRDGAHIEVFLLYHLIGFDNLRYIDHTFKI